MKFQPGLRVVIEQVIYDPTEDIIQAFTPILTPLAKIRIPSRRVTGYQLLIGLHPFIPPRTLIHLRREGNATLRLASSQNADLDSGLDLGEEATAKVLRYVPLTGGRDLYVTIFDGKWAERSGWVFTSDGVGDGGHRNFPDATGQYFGPPLNDEQRAQDPVEELLYAIGTPSKPQATTAE